jgi:hypothetical protein
MNSLRLGAFLSLAAGTLFLLIAVLTISRVQAADVAASQNTALPVEHPECSYFGPQRDRFTQAALNRMRAAKKESAASALTRQVTALLPAGLPGGSHNHDVSVSTGQDTIDSYIFAALQTNGIAPAESTSDFEFIRRVTLDLTGRIPTPSAVLAFVNSTDPSKRAQLIDQLLASPQWVDKWTVFFSDLFKNTSSNSQIVINNEGRNAFYKWIHDSLANGKPYNQMATELIDAQGNNNSDQAQGNMNFLVLAFQGNGPTQDVYDSQTAQVFESFMGMAHVNCLLCHNGRGHLDSLSLWAASVTRYQAWGLSSFLSHTTMHGYRSPQDPNNPKAGTLNYWGFDTGSTDYTLNTTIGNRPARQPLAGQAKTVTPLYLDQVSTAQKGSDYRAALAQYVTGDIQFARAAVNYVWAHFFGLGIVDPPDQFDLARLDPNNPPPAPWTLQPSNPQLLNSLAHHFINSGYDLKALMREIANSQTYQFSSRYNGSWNATLEPYFARHFVRRMWAEELHDSVVTATGIVPTYTVPGFSNDSTIYGVNSPGFGQVSFAMQLPDVKNEPDGGGAVSQFLDSFLRGDRDLTPRKSEGSILQALNLMNDNFIESRIHSTGSNIKGSNLVAAMSQPDQQLVNTLYLTVLSRYPTQDEMTKALNDLSINISHSQAAEDLFWSLFNKVDFVFNY